MFVILYKGQAWYGGYQTRTGHSATGQGGDWGAARICGSTGGAYSSTEIATPWTSWWS